jgi:hypothetical protein
MDETGFHQHSQEIQEIAGALRPFSAFRAVENKIQKT